ncbi:hypothetical protein GPECTOR_62g934 [Gonium pectorale]|uniref:Uncharacterized protein n=1 Tax=Gonium pectorale TaxID=33097 RepID=A0A150G4K7_GONPE|nr:hypothetical protein GPECTOR_62g934 [Gonium pectorale]|eukprot:KXZ44819.1 hypothetical protein GPECTOR_62g934 [Gonium pectorale]
MTEKKSPSINTDNVEDTGEKGSQKKTRAAMKRAAGAVKAAADQRDNEADQGQSDSDHDEETPSPKPKKKKKGG